MNNMCACLYMCVYVCERGSAERNEGHPDDLDICKWRRLMKTIILTFNFFLNVRMYEEYLHSLTSSLSGGQKLVRQCPPPTPCLPVNGHPSDCQGISQVVAQLTLTYFIHMVWGSISVACGVSHDGYTSLEYCHSWCGCWVSLS